MSNQFILFKKNTIFTLRFIIIHHEINPFKRVKCGSRLGQSERSHDMAPFDFKKIVLYFCNHQSIFFFSPYYFCKDQKIQPEAKAHYESMKLRSKIKNL